MFIPQQSRRRRRRGLTPAVVHRDAKLLQHVIDSDHFRVTRAMPKAVGFSGFVTTPSTIARFEAMLWLRKRLGFASDRTGRRQNEWLALCFEHRVVNEG
jgi:transposase-like protein